MGSGPPVPSLDLPMNFIHLIHFMSENCFQIVYFGRIIIILSLSL